VGSILHGYLVVARIASQGRNHSEKLALDKKKILSWKLRTDPPLDEKAQPNWLIPKGKDDVTVLPFHRTRQNPLIEEGVQLGPVNRMNPFGGQWAEDLDESCCRLHEFLNLIEGPQPDNRHLQVGYPFQEFRISQQPPTLFALEKEIAVKGLSRNPESFLQIGTEVMSIVSIYRFWP